MLKRWSKLLWEQRSRRAQSRLRFKLRSADRDFDVVLRAMWERHLLTMPADVAKTKRWRSGYWKRWFDGAVIDIDSHVRKFVEGDVLVAHDPLDDVESSVVFFPLLMMTGMLGLQNIINTQKAAEQSRNSP